MENDKMNAEKLKVLSLTLEKLEKTYGKGAVMKLGEKPIDNIEVISTGSIGLNAALGVGGLPKGRVIEIFGPESSGKTTLAIHAIAEAQKKGGIAAFIDAEHAFDRFYAEKLGVNIGELLVAQPDNGEQALEIADMLVYGQLSRNVSSILGKVGNVSINTLFNVIPGINLSENGQLLNELNKIPAIELNSKCYRKFVVDILGNINGNNYVICFRWVN